MRLLLHSVHPASSWGVFDMLTPEARRRYLTAVGEIIMASRRTDLFLQVKDKLRTAQRTETQITDDELAEQLGIKDHERPIIEQARRDLAADTTTLNVQSTVHSP